MSVGIEAAFPRVLFTIGPLAIKDSVFYTWILLAILGSLALASHRRYRIWRPRTWQLGVEYFVEYVETLITDTLGRTLPGTVPYLTSMILYIGLANVLGLVPTMRSPTRDINTTAALSIVSLASTQYFGAVHRGVKGQLRSFLEPVAMMLPLNIIGMLSRSVSMALRLFGNVLAGEIIGLTLFSLMPVLAPLPMNLLAMITGLLQALVFTVLTIVFVADAMRISE
jgi:F-type H+-transporting ATPase subunit a